MNLSFKCVFLDYVSSVFSDAIESYVGGTIKVNTKIMDLSSFFHQSLMRDSRSYYYSAYFVDALNKVRASISNIIIIMKNTTVLIIVYISFHK